MKKFFIALMLCVVSIMSFGQLNIQPIEDYAGYKTIYTVKCPMHPHLGEIRYFTKQKVYVLLGESDNQFEKTMVSIVLGDTKESTIKSLYDLKDFTQNTPNYEVSVVTGCNDKTTKIYTYNCGFGVNGLYMKTDGVAGESYVGTYIFATTTERTFEKIINAIKEFEE